MPRWRCSVADFRWGVVCSRAIVDKFSNTLSIIEVLDDVTAELQQEVPDPIPEDTWAPINFHLLSLWKRTDKAQPEKKWCHYAVVTPDGKEHSFDLHQEIDLEGHVRGRLIAVVRKIKYGGEGTYCFKWYVSDDLDGEQIEVGQMQLEVKVKPFEGSSNRPDGENSDPEMKGE